METTPGVVEDTVDWRKMINMLNSGKLMPVLSSKALLNLLFRSDRFFDDLVRECASSVYSCYDLSATENLLARSAQYYMVQQKWDEADTKTEYLKHIRRKTWSQIRLDYQKLAEGDQELARTLLPEGRAELIERELDRYSSVADLVMKVCRYAAFLQGATTHPLCRLCKLNIELFLTTCPFTLLESALAAANPNKKFPQTMSYAWKREGSAAQTPTMATAVFDSDHPMVYHLHGLDDDVSSLVLTEEDYLEFIEHLQTVFFDTEGLVPHAIRLAIVDSHYPVLLGFDLNSWDLRVLWRLMKRRKNSSTRGCAIQIDPSAFLGDGNGSLANARLFLERYFEDVRLDVAWTTPGRFIAKLCDMAEEPSHANP